MFPQSLGSICSCLGCFFAYFLVSLIGYLVDQSLMKPVEIVVFDQTSQVSGWKEQMPEGNCDLFFADKAKFVEDSFEKGAAPCQWSDSKSSRPISYTKGQDRSIREVLTFERPWDKSKSKFR